MAQVTARHWLASSSEIPQEAATSLVGALAWRGLGSFPKVGGEANASTRVLTKCGFRHVGEVMDPEDGLVWRWEKHKE